MEHFATGKVNGSAPASAEVGSVGIDLRHERSRRLQKKLWRELGPELLTALHDDGVVEVMLNEGGQVWLDYLRGGMARARTRISTEQAENLLGTVAALVGTVIHEESPILECELPFLGCRFEGIVPPVSRAPVFSIRKHARRIHELADYERRGQLDPRDAEALRRAIREQGNIVICGGASSGKTTLANAVLAEKVALRGGTQRIVILEDTIELQCSAPNTVQLRSAPTVPLRQLVRATLRLRPDSIVVGEVRGAEALDMLKAWNTGHPGGLTTVHANRAASALSRFDQLIQEAGVPSQPALLADAIDLIVSIGFVGGERRVTEVLRVAGYDGHSGRFELVPAAGGNQ